MKEFKQSIEDHVISLGAKPPKISLSNIPEIESRFQINSFFIFFILFSPIIHQIKIIVEFLMHLLIFKKEIFHSLKNL